MMNRLKAIVPIVALATVCGISGLGQSLELQDAVIGVFELAAPAVVHIAVRGTAENFLMQPVPVEGNGSGFLFDNEGHIITNYHVVEGADEITVSFDQVECCSAEVIGLDPSTDLAVIKVARQDLPQPLQLANSDTLQVGQFVVAIGNPFGLQQAMTLGIISALGRVIQSPDGRFIGEAIQTDATINPGNSGGPLLDLEGKVIGVNSQIISPVRGSSGVGFAIPANAVARVVTALIAEGRYPHPYLGITGYGLTPELIQLFRENDAALPFDRGMMVASVDPDGPAAQSGVMSATAEIDVGGYDIPVQGDIIVAVNGVDVNSMLDIIFYLDLNTRAGDDIVLTVLRDDVTIDITAQLEERPF